MDPKDNKGGEVIVKKEGEVVPAPVVVEEKSLLQQKDDEIAQLTTERNNYRTAALARKGKLPADSEFLGDDFDAFVDEKIKSALVDNEITRKQAEKDAEYARVMKENSELRLAAQNRPGGAMGGSGGGSTVEVKDNVFSAAQIDALTQKAKRLGADPVQFIEKAKQNLARRA